MIYFARNNSEKFYFTAQLLFCLYGNVLSSAEAGTILPM